jgi:hypothetical protein
LEVCAFLVARTFHGFLSGLRFCFIDFILYFFFILNSDTISHQLSFPFKPIYSLKYLIQIKMGGKTFGVEARRLDSTQHAALFKYVQTQLNPFTPFGLRTTRSPADKTTHGDLDVMIGSHANGPGFKYQFAGEASEYANLPQPDYGKWSGMASTAEHQWSEQELKDWIRDVARALGAVVWQKHRIGAIFAVPCRFIGDLAAEAGPNEVSSLQYIEV